MRLENTKYYWTYLLFGFLCVLLGTALLPQWATTEVFFKSWGAYSVNITISGLIFGYIVFYLVKRIKRYSNTPAQVVAMVELVIMAVIAVICTVSLFVSSVSLGEPCQIFALAIWARGVSGVFTGYYCDSKLVMATEEERRAEKMGDEAALAQAREKKKNIDTEAKPKGVVDDFTVWRLAFAVLLISAGTYLFANPLIKAVHLQWVFSGTTIAVGLLFMVFGFFKKPAKVKVDGKAPTSEKENEKQEEQNEQEKVGNTEKKSTASVEIKEDGTKKLEPPKEKKVSIALSDGGANAVTQTAAYDAVKDEEK